MGTTCIRCSQPAEGVLCGACRARLRVLLSARAGVRGAIGQPLQWLQAGVAALALVLVVAGLLRQAGAAGEPAVPGQGVWKVLGGATFGLSAAAMPTSVWKSSVYSEMSRKYTRLPPDRPWPRWSRA